MKTKKNHFPVLSGLFLLCILVISCSKKDAAPKYSDLIVGKWYIKKVVGNDGTIYIPKNSCEEKSAFEFTKNKEFSFFTYSQSGGLCKSTIVEGTYSIIEDEKQIAISDETTSEILDIKKLDTKTLEIYAPSISYTYIMERDI